MIRHSFRNKLLLLFLLISFVPIALLGYWSVHSSRDALQQQVEYDLNALVDERVKAIESYYQAHKRALAYLATTEQILEALDVLVSSYSVLGVDAPLYKSYVDTYKPLMEMLKESSGFLDLYLVSVDGDVVFSAEQKSDYATNLHTGKYRDTQLARVFKRALTLLETGISERQPYAPANNQLTEFIAVPVFNNLRISGVLVAQLKSDILLRQFADYTGLGQTGEVMFASRQGNHAVVVAPLRHNARSAGMLKIEIGAGHSQPIQLAVRGDNSSGLSIDYRGVETISAWRYLPDLNWGIAAKIDAVEAFARADNQRLQILLFVALSVLLAILTGLYLSGRVSRPLTALAKATQAMSRGEIDTRLDVASSDEIGRVAEAHNAMLDDLQVMVERIDYISRGDLEAEVEPRSDVDTLGKAMQRLTHSLRDTAEIAGAVAQGDLESKVSIKGDNDRLGCALAEMVKNLRQRHWHMQGHQALGKVLDQNHSLDEFCEQTINAVCTHFGTPIGAIYVPGEHDVLELRGGYGFVRGAEQVTKYAPGEGLIGQAARLCAPVVLDDIPKDYLQIKSGLGETAVRHLIVYPVVHSERVEAVLEFAALTPFDDAHMSMLESFAGLIGINIVAAQSRDKQQQLLEETLKQSVLLQESERALSERQQELQASNEELTQQAEELRQSQEGLQQQREELRVTNEELEEQKRAIAQQNVALEKARHEAEQKTHEVEQASRYKSEFLANMSHELRTPLNSLLILAKSFAENDDGNLNTEQVEAGEIIHSSATDLLELINGILDLSKIEAGKMMVHGAEMSLSGFADNVERQFKHVAANKGLDFTLEVADGLADSIYTDEVKVGQIIKNLLSNAFKFTSEGGVTVRLQNPPDDLSESRSIAIAVSDSGIGIPEEKQALIFEAFQQADGSTSRSYGGTGLGLSICREMARMLGGEIRVRSVPNTGSTFTLYLPQRLPQSDNLVEMDNTPVPTEPDKPVLTLVADSTPAELTDHDDDPLVDDDRAKISANDDAMLVIEDDPAFAGVVVDMVRSKGFKCIAAHSGNAGVRLARRYQPTGILLDLGLPDMDGADVIEHLKTGTDTRHIPIHILSGRGITERLDGAIGVLCKPIRSSDLEKALTKIETFARGRLRELLIVEDDPATQTVIRRVVGGDNVNITVAQTGAESLALLTENTYDCVILDLGLPDIDGFALLEKITDSEDIEKPPLIVYSARDLSEGDYEKLRGYTDSIVVKGAYSDSRLRDEASLFLHSVRKRIEERQPDLSPVEPDADAGDLHKKTVLLVDDDMRNIYALSRGLKRHGLTVLVAKDGTKALEQLDMNGDDVDIVLMDIMMPVMDGHETTRRIREQSQFRELPIIALTAHAMAEDRERCLQAGASDYMAKPVDIERLLAMMKVWLCK